MKKYSWFIGATALLFCAAMYGVVTRDWVVFAGCFIPAIFTGFKAGWYWEGRD